MWHEFQNLWLKEQVLCTRREILCQERNICWKPQTWKWMKMGCCKNLQRVHSSCAACLGPLPPDLRLCKVSRSRTLLLAVPAQKKRLCARSHALKKGAGQWSRAGECSGQLLWGLGRKAGHKRRRATPKEHREQLRPKTTWPLPKFHALPLNSFRGENLPLELGNSVIC